MESLDDILPKDWDRSAQDAYADTLRAVDSYLDQAEQALECTTQTDAARRQLVESRRRIRERAKRMLDDDADYPRLVMDYLATIRDAIAAREVFGGNLRRNAVEPHFDYNANINRMISLVTDVLQNRTEWKRV